MLSMADTGTAATPVGLPWWCQLVTSSCVLTCPAFSGTWDYLRKWQGRDVVPIILLGTLTIIRTKFLGPPCHHHCCHCCPSKICSYIEWEAWTCIKLWTSSRGEIRVVKQICAHAAHLRSTRDILNPILGSWLGCPQLIVDNDVDKKNPAHGCANKSQPTFGKGISTVKKFCMHNIIFLKKQKF